MKTILVTGAKGFIGKNLVVALKQREAFEIIEHDVDSPPGFLETSLTRADIIYHLAGVNRPERDEEFTAVNAELTRQICESLRRLGRAPSLVLSSSIQATQDNPYGLSKRQAEEAVFSFGRETDAPVHVFRLPGVFGKWCRPNYNSVVATFCHCIAHDLPISVSDPSRVVELVYVDDVCVAMMVAASLLQNAESSSPVKTGGVYPEVVPSFKITLGDLADTIRSFRNSRLSLEVPAFNNPFICRLYATYLSYLEGADFVYNLDMKSDNRGSLAEFLKSNTFGQIFVSRTKPGISRGNHYHNTKTEKFLVLQGQAIIRLRDITREAGEQRAGVIEHAVTGEEFRVVDIPPGYTHSIENVGSGELVTLFWADEVFNPDLPDTFFEEVLKKTREGETNP